MTEQSVDLKLDQIQADTRAQSRAEIDIVVVGEYADDMKAGATFPPLVVFHDQTTYWLAEGFHRYHAYQQAEITTVPAIVKIGGLREAILQSLGSNADHGKRRSNADKRRAVEMMLRDSEWVKWSDREIARRCAVSNNFVSDLRKDPFICHPMTDTKTATRNGTTYTIQTGNIGKKAEPVVVETLPLPVAVVAPPQPPVFLGTPDEDEPPFEDEFEDEDGNPVSFDSTKTEPDEEELAFLAALEAEAEALPDNAFDEVDPDPAAPVVIPVPVIPVVAATPVSIPPVSTADPRQMGYIGASPVVERDANDWHTPAKYIEAVRSALGGIDLDPFSSAKANETVQAARFFTADDDALGETPWFANRLFMNPPYGRGVIDLAVDRFLRELKERNFKEAIVLVNNATETQWFQSLMRECSAICFTDHRISFASPDNKQESGNTRGQAFFYFGNNFYLGNCLQSFIASFNSFGVIMQVLS